MVSSRGGLQPKRPQDKNESQMSRDNGIFVLVTGTTKPEYRICIAHAIENVIANSSLLVATFKNADYFTDLEQAKEHALKLGLETPTEYGVCYIHKFQHKTFDQLSQEV